MSDPDQLTDTPEVRGLRDALSGIALPERPRLDAIKARGLQRRRHRRTQVVRLSVAGATAALVVSVGLIAALSPASRLGTIRTAAYTLRHNHNGTDTLTLNPAELVNPSQLQSDLAQYGIPAKVTSGSYCTSNPVPAGFSQVVSGPGPGTWRAGSSNQPTMTIDPSQMPSGAELSVGYFKLTTGQFAGEQQANMSLIDTSSYTCTSTPPDMSKPDTSNDDFGVLYGGPSPAPGS